ncbi:hypothetical protein [Bradyrhizobium sp. LA6.12]|uniref:hypothetical protein n=1 Tax=unclassified Bradyrhizobium TaxID=2631580 RepID=UPI0033924A87
MIDDEAAIRRARYEVLLDLLNKGSDTIVERVMREYLARKNYKIEAESQVVSDSICIGHGARKADDV